MVVQLGISYLVTSQQFYYMQLQLSHIQPGSNLSYLSLNRGLKPRLPWECSVIFGEPVVPLVKKIFTESSILVLAQEWSADWFL